MCDAEMESSDNTVKYYSRILWTFRTFWWLVWYEDYWDEDQNPWRNPSGIVFKEDGN